MFTFGRQADNKESVGHNTKSKQWGHVYGKIKHFKFVFMFRLSLVMKRITF